LALLPPVLLCADFHAAGAPLSIAFLPPIFFQVDSKGGAGTSHDRFKAEDLRVAASTTAMPARKVRASGCWRFDSQTASRKTMNQGASCPSW
jgi:hypothetical protein